MYVYLIIFFAFNCNEIIRLTTFHFYISSFWS